MIRWSRTVLVAALLAAPVAAAGQAGERCRPDEDPPREGLLCRPAFIKIGGQLEEEWEYDPSYILNARKGDSILSPDCGTIGNLLRKVSPPQRNSHSGIMVVDRYQVRHSTAAEERPGDYGVGSEPGSDGVREDVLRFGWPGPITEFVDEAFEGHFLQDPESGQGYELNSFNPHVSDCNGSGDLVPATVLKPPPDVESMDGDPTRAQLHAAADVAAGLAGHYRFFGYTDPSDILYTPISHASWANGTVGSVCSALVWRALTDAGFVLEGGALEPQDVTAGAQIDAQTLDGLYLYTESERLNAAHYLHDKFHDEVSEKAGFWGDLFTDAADDVANQVVNCFGFDWCGPTFSAAASAAGCDFEDNAKDSDCWTDPGLGRAVSPDDMMRWDGPPTGPYGNRQDLFYQVGDFVRVYRWGPADGAGTLKGTVKAGGNAPVGDALVTIDGLEATDVTPANGKYEIVGVPQGPWTVRACKGDIGDDDIFTMPLDGKVTRNLTIAGGCLPTVSVTLWHRTVHITGSMHVVDHETVGSNETATFSIDETLVLEPPTEAAPGVDKAEVTVSKCVGDEVRARIKFKAALDVHDRSVDVDVTGELFEEDECPNSDLDGTGGAFVRVEENDAQPTGLDMANEDWDGDDTVTLSVTVANQQTVN